MSQFIIIFVILFGLSNGIVIKYNAGNIVQKQQNQNLTPMLRALTELKLNLIKENSQAVVQGQSANPEDPTEVISANFPQKKIDVMASLINSKHTTKEVPKVASKTKYVIVNPTKIIEKSPKRRKSYKKRKNSDIDRARILQEAESIQVPAVVPTPVQYHPNSAVYTPEQNHQTSVEKMFERNGKLIHISMGSNSHLNNHRRSDMVIGDDQDYQHIDRPENKDYLQRKTNLDVGPVISVLSTAATPRQLEHGHVPTFTEQQLLEFVPYIIEELRNKIADPNNEEMAHIFGDLWELMVEESKRDVNFENMSPILKSILNSNKPKHPRTRYTRESSNQKYFNINPFDKKFEYLKKKTTKPTKKPLNNLEGTVDKSGDKKEVTLGEELMEIDEDDDYYDSDYTNADAISRSSAFDENASIYELINLAASRKLTKMHQDQLRRALDSADDEYTDDEENVDYIYK